MFFTSYEKMPEQLKALHLDKQESRKLDKVNWVVNEKVHGANFSFIINSEGINYAKRKSLLKWTDDFFGFQRVAKSLQTSLFLLYDFLKEEYPSLQSLQLYGELYGGTYPHENVAVVEDVFAIQTGVYYHPDIQFSAFDLAVDLKEKDRFYLGYQRFEEFCEAAHIPYLKALFKGNFSHALNFDIAIDSPIPLDFGLPPIANNMIEGVVVRPYEALTVRGAKGCFRPIIKKKSPAFTEKVIYHQAKKWSYQIREDKDELEFYILELENYLNTHRVMSAISKLGRPKTADELGRLRHTIWLDIIESYYEDLETTEKIEFPSLLQQRFFPKINRVIEDSLAQ